MNKFYLFFVVSFINNFIFSKNEISSLAPLEKTIEEPKKEIITEKKASKKKEPETFLFNYVNEDISKIVMELAALKKINYIPPQPPNKINEKLTFVMDDELPIDQAWNLLVSALDKAGYTLTKNDVDSFYRIFKNDTVTKESLPLFVNSIEKLPDTDEKIRFIYFFKNISISEQGSQSHSNIDQILKDMLSSEAEGSTYMLDGSSNSLIIVSRSTAIKGVMKIIKELDTAGFPEVIEVVPLQHTKSDFIAKIINQLIPANQEPQFRYGPFPAKTSKLGGYFSESAKIIPIERTNSIAIMGPPDTVQRIKDFVGSYLDLPIKSEKSVIHVKSVNYLNADELAPVVQNLVKSRSAVAQAEAAPSDRDTLANAIIVAEKLVQAPTITPTTPASQGAATPAPTSTAPLVGGNRLIVAARHNDWLTINSLVDELDQPQMQVALEVLVVDLTMDDNKLIGSQMRNMADCGPSGVNWQTDMLKTGVAIPPDVPGSVPGQSAPGAWMNFKNEDVPAEGFTQQGLSSDLLKLTKNKPYSDGTTLTNIAKLATAGSTILSFKDGNGIAQILQVLNDYDSTAILSQPFVVTKNNQQANLSIAKELLIPMGVTDNSTGGPIIRKTQYVKADLTVNILPRLSKAGDINLEILVNVNDFLTPNNVNDFRIATRQVRTNSNLKNKEVLVIGGLSRVDTTDTVSETPILSKIPIFGFLFKNKQQTISRKNLMIFISPTIIKPRLQGGMDMFTKNKVDFVKSEVTDTELAILGTNFEHLRDPITRVYFKPLTRQINDAIDYFAKQEAYVAGSEEAFDKQGRISPVGGSLESVNTNAANEKTKAKKIKDLTRNHKNPLTN